jgi:hypothetical protein
MSGVFTLFTLFTAFFDGTEGYFDCKNWLVVKVQNWVKIFPIIIAQMFYLDKWVITCFATLLK